MSHLPSNCNKTNDTLDTYIDNSRRYIGLCSSCIINAHSAFGNCTKKTARATNCTRGYL